MTTRFRFRVRPLRVVIFLLATLAGYFVMRCGGLAAQHGHDALAVMLFVIGGIMPVVSINDLI